VHINTHFAIGIIIASIFHGLYNFTLLEFGFIVVCGFIMDFDIFFTKYARGGNHRMLVSHSILPGVLILIIGLFLIWSALIIGGLSYIIHITVDTLDWGTNFFGIHKKPFGPKYLITKEELENIDEILSQYKIKKSFFDFRYYNKKIVLVIELILLIGMIISLVIFALEFILISIIYIPFLLLHVLGYLQMKKIEDK
jgi:hypothetical protein